MTDLFLTSDEVADLTGRTRRDAQACALRSMGIEHRVRPNGTVAVLRAHVEMLLGGASRAGVKIKTTTPDWGKLDASQTPR